MQPLFDDVTSSWDMDALDIPLLREAHSYWLGKQENGCPVPLRSAIEPLEIPRLLPYLFLIEVSQLQPMRFRMRLIGTSFRRFLDADLTGLEIDEAAGNHDLAMFCPDWREVLQAEKPRWARIRQTVGRDGIAEIRFTSLVMPLSRDGTAADMLLGITLYDDPVPA